MELYLVRHAIAEPRDPERWPDDAVRPLSKPGIRLFRVAARGVRRVGIEVEAVLTSPYVRAYQTAEILVREAGWPRAVENAALEPASRPSATVDAVREQRVHTLALVGHQPHLSELASLLLTGAQASQIELKKGGVIWLRFDGAVAPGSALLRGSLSPKVLRELGR